MRASQPDLHPPPRRCISKPRPDDCALQVQELKDALTARGLDTGGLKKDLQKRLLDSLTGNGAPAAEAAADSQVNVDDSGAPPAADEPGAPGAEAPPAAEDEAAPAPASEESPPPPVQEEPAAVSEPAAARAEDAPAATETAPLAQDEAPPASEGEAAPVEAGVNSAVPAAEPPVEAPAPA
eukprot:scaffold14829_cov115-Isochrysis_galbana.AAC.1